MEYTNPETHCPETSAPVGVGFSKLVDTPEVVAILSKQNKRNNIIFIVGSILPLIVCVIIGIFSEMKFTDLLLIGVAVSLVFFLFGLISKLKKKRSKSYIGTVIEKKEVQKKKKNDDAYITEYVITIRDDKGKDHKEVEGPLIRSYNYLNVGERVRYLPQFPYPFEKEDKAKDGEMICMFCSRKTSIYNICCQHCKNPVIK